MFLVPSFPYRCRTSPVNELLASENERQIVRTCSCRAKFKSAYRKMDLVQGQWPKFHGLEKLTDGTTKRNFIEVAPLEF